jgi:16S rRNA (adenine1518-N6/adenine1519-N6)-dimethyltransferase
MIANINYVKSVMGELKAKKKFGQNFLIDHNIVDKIARIACKEEYKTIEIGPGLGALTEMLLKYAKDVDAYEIDPDMYERLTENLKDERLKVFKGDFLKADLSIYRERVNVCGNLPYYVTTPILFELIESDLDIGKITVMVQKEVGDRLAAPVGSEDYGALSIEVQYLFAVKQEMNVSRKVFYPEPNVDSVMISFTPIRERDHEFERGFFTFVKNCFRMRRKTLRNNLKDLCDSEKLEEACVKAGIDPSVRPQQLTLDNCLDLYGYLKEK